MTCAILVRQSVLPCKYVSMMTHVLSDNCSVSWCVISKCMCVIEEEMHKYLQRVNIRECS